MGMPLVNITSATTTDSNKSNSTQIQKKKKKQTKRHSNSNTKGVIFVTAAQHKMKYHHQPSSTVYILNIAFCSILCGHVN